jgi:Trk K+ transport system NAD-binding subunit
MSDGLTFSSMFVEKQNRLLRKFRASWRDTWLLIREFSWPLLFFCTAIIGGGILYYTLSLTTESELDNVSEGIYQVLSLTFLQSVGDFPGEWYLEIFYFIMPVIGLILLAQGVTEFGVMLFNRRARGKEWEQAVASTLSNHVILIGLGHLGFRVAMHLNEMDQDVVIVEQNPKADLVSSVRDLGITVIQEDATRESALEAANIRKARAIILCTQNDSMNLQIALKARRLNPKIQVIVRIFDNDFAESLRDQFGYTAFSATGMAAPAFAAAAAGVDMTSPITVEGEILSLAHLQVNPASRLSNRKVGDIEQSYNISVVLVRSNHISDLHPAADREINPGDLLAILGGSAEISLLAKDNRTY